MLNRVILLVAVFCLLFLPQLSYSSHQAGATVRYECLSPEEYRVSVVVYRDCSGIPFTPRTIQVAFRSDCSEKNSNCRDGSFTAFRTPGTGLPVPDECVDLPPTTCFGGTRFGLEAYEFEGIFRPAREADSCQGWTFFWSDAQPARNNSITLLPGGATYASAYLNNRNQLNPCNNSAFSDIPYLPAFCVNEPAVLKFNYQDPDGDSLAFIWQQAKNLPATVPDCNGTAAVYRAPYSASNPGSSSTGWIIDNVGNIHFTPNQVQTVVLCFKVEEWRGKVLAGWTWVDLQVRIDIDPIICTQSKIPTYEKDTLFLSCGDSLLKFELSTNVHCNTVTRNASEWRLYSAQTDKAIQVDSCWIVNCNVLTNVSPEFVIETFEPLLENGNYYLYPKVGDDGDTFGNQCGKDMKEFDTLVVNVSGCYEFDDPPVLTNVSVEPLTNEDFIVQWEESKSIDPDFFSAYVLYANEDPGNQVWQEIERFADLKDILYLHQTPSRLPVNGSMHYALGIEYNLLNGSGLNFKKMTPLSNIISSIHCVNYPNQIDPEDEYFDLSWNEYQGWRNANYKVEYSLDKPKDWLFDGSTNQINYQLRKPLEEGKYFARCFTDKVLDSGDLLRAYSNWIPMSVPKRALSIPNVITPNGDGKNDYLNIKNIEFYPNSEVLVYNRWGNEVYSSANYVNDHKTAFGSDVKTGVYYWLVKVSESEQLKGTVKVIE